MTISHMAMNVGHQVFLNSCWGLKCTTGRTKVSSLSIPPQQPCGVVEVIQRDRSKQKNGAERHLWSFLGKDLGVGQTTCSVHKGSNTAVHILCDHFLAGNQSNHPAIELGVYMLLWNQSQDTSCVKQEEFPVIFHQLPIHPKSEYTISLHLFQLFCRGHITSRLISKQLWKLVSVEDFLNLRLGVMENCEGLRWISQPIRIDIISELFLALLPHCKLLP